MVERETGRVGILLFLAAGWIVQGCAPDLAARHCARHGSAAQRGISETTSDPESRPLMLGALGSEASVVIRQHCDKGLRVAQQQGIDIFVTTQ